MIIKKGRTQRIEIIKFCIAKKYSSAMTSITLIDVLKSLSLDLINKVEKSDIRDACVFQYKMPKPIQQIYALLSGTCKTVE